MVKIVILLLIHLSFLILTTHIAIVVSTCALHNALSDLCCGCCPVNDWIGTQEVQFQADIRPLDVLEMTFKLDK